MKLNPSLIDELITILVFLMDKVVIVNRTITAEEVKDLNILNWVLNNEGLTIQEVFNAIEYRLRDRLAEQREAVKKGADPYTLSLYVKLWNALH